MIYMYDVSKKKNCTNCFCKVFFKFPYHEIYNFWQGGDKIAEVVHSFSSSPYSCHDTTLLKTKGAKFIQNPSIVLYCIQVFIQRPSTAIGKQRRIWFDQLQEKRQVLRSDKDVERLDDRRENVGDGVFRRFEAWLH